MADDVNLTQVAQDLPGLSGKALLTHMLMHIMLKLHERQVRSPGT